MRSRIRNYLADVKWRGALKNYALLTLGSVLMILVFNIFIAPSKLAPGGVAGITIIINSYIGWPNGIIMLVLNIPLLILGFLYLGRFRFLVRTLYVALVYNLGIDLFAFWFSPKALTDDLMLNAFFGGVIGGIATGLMYRGRGTSPGTGIVSRVLQLRTGIPMSQLYVAIDGAVILALGLRFGWENALYAMIMLFVWGLAADYTLEGPSVVRTAFIITNAPEAVGEALVNRMRVGVTAWPGQGMFTKREHAVLFCTISRPDVGSLKAVVAMVDPEAFVVIGQGQEAHGGVLSKAMQQEDVNGPIAEIEGEQEQVRSNNVSRR